MACESGTPTGDSGVGLGGTSATTGGSGNAAGGAATGGSQGNGASGGSASSGGRVSGGAPGVGGTGVGGTGVGGTIDASGGASGKNGWALVWRDEFDGTEIDKAKWEHEVNCWGGGNNEDQCYVNESKNAFVEAGQLHVRVLGDSPSGPEGGGSDNPANVVTRGHSSARLRTKGKADFKYGRMEASLKLPSTQGLWPAFWMLPTDEIYGGWAASGEIDILEAVNLDPEESVYGTLHYGGIWPDNVHTGASFVPTSKAWENFHLYAVEWQEGEIRWFVDDEQYALQNEWNTAEGAPFPAPFDQKFHLILNVAIGGSWPGSPDASTRVPQEMVVDYVRVFECEADPITGIGCGTRDPDIDPL